MSIPQERWRLLPYSEGPAGEELAMAEGLLAGLEEEGRPAMRWYGAREPALVIGSGQRPHEVDGAAVAAAGAPPQRGAPPGAAGPGPGYLEATFAEGALGSLEHVALASAGEGARAL
ncbi:MAG TPA: hypothetical protein PKD53_31475 [Chloroflexaceae bacterium]|nr:hypothetical protein [Chloroflexaceae bacterium]